MGKSHGSYCSYRYGRTGAWNRRPSLKAMRGFADRLGQQAHEAAMGGDLERAAVLMQARQQWCGRTERLERARQLFPDKRRREYYLTAEDLRRQGHAAAMAGNLERAAQLMESGQFWDVAADQGLDAATQWLRAKVHQQQAERGLERCPDPYPGPLPAVPAMA